MLCLEGELWLPDGILKEGRILIREGRIQDLGPKDRVPCPSGWTHRIYHRGEKILPGFVEAHAHFGLYTEVTAEDRLNRKDSLIAWDYVAGQEMNREDLSFAAAALEGGITTACLFPGSGALIGGVASVVSLSPGIPLLKEVAALKVALGENVEGEYSLKTSVLKERLFRLFEEGVPEGNGPLGRALRGELPVRVHVHREEDIRTALELKERFGLRMVLEHATEAHRCLTAVVDSEVAVVTGPFFVGRPKGEMRRLDRSLTRSLVEKGVELCIMSDYPSNPPDMLKMAMLEVVKWGVEERKALEMVTLGAARLLGVEDVVGSLEVGKWGDVVIHSASPFDYGDKILEVYGRGERLEWPNIG